MCEKIDDRVKVSSVFSRILTTHIPLPRLSTLQGFKRGSEDALNRIDSEVERHARTAYARALLEEEERRASAVKQELARLGKSYYK